MLTTKYKKKSVLNHALKEKVFNLKHVFLI